MNQLLFMAKKMG